MLAVNGPKLVEIHTVGRGRCWGCGYHQFPSAKGCSLVTSLLCDLGHTGVHAYLHFQKGDSKDRLYMCPVWVHCVSV